MGVSEKWRYPPFHTPKWSFLVGKPMVVGETHHFRKHPNSFQLQGFRETKTHATPKMGRFSAGKLPQLEILSADEARLDPILRVPWEIWVAVTFPTINEELKGLQENPQNHQNGTPRPIIYKWNASIGWWTKSLHRKCLFHQTSIYKFPGSTRLFFSHQRNQMLRHLGFLKKYLLS